MGQLKIGIATGFPFSSEVIGHLGISTGLCGWEFKHNFQTSINNKGIRPATQEEILANQDFIRKHWNPEVGDNVVLDYPLYSITTSTTIEGKIVEKHSYQFKVEFTNYAGAAYHCLEAIVPRAEDWAVVKEEVEETDDEYSSLVSSTGVEFKKLHAGVQADLRKLDFDFVKTMFSLMIAKTTLYERDSLSSFLNGFATWDHTPQGYVFWERIKDWICNNNNFDDANNLFKEWKLEPEETSLEETKEVEPRPEPIMEEIYPKRFKVGDKVTYKSIEELGGRYHFNGDNQGGSVGTIVEYVDYNENKKCYSIIVTSTRAIRYIMLESEFREYDNMKESVPIKEKLTPEPKFKVGDKVTYKSLEEAGGRYYHGGGDHGGSVGTIVEYLRYNESKKCYKISVTSKENFNYSMLESEFREYDKLKPSVSSKFYVEVPVPEVYRHNVMLIEKTKKVKKVIDVSSYSQEPILISKRPVKTKIKPII